MNKILLWSICAALAGFLFGFDTVVISGADQQLQELWGTSDFVHGTIVMAMALWGTVVGAIFGGIPTNKLGRKKTLIIIGVLYFISALGSALVDGPYIFAFFQVYWRFGRWRFYHCRPGLCFRNCPGKRSWPAGRALSVQYRTWNSYCISFQLPVKRYRRRAVEMDAGCGSNSGLHLYPVYFYDSEKSALADFSRPNPGGRKKP